MIVVRVLSRGRAVREAVFTGYPVTLGRGAGNGFVLSDPSVSRVHARVELGEDGRLRVVDLDSRNGLLVGRRAVREIALDRRVVCRIGRVVVELEPVSDAPTLELDPRESGRLGRRRAPLHPVLYLAGGVAVMVASTVVQPSFWSPWSHTRWTDLVGVVIGAGAGLSMLGGILFVVLKALGRSVRLGDVMRAVWLLSWLGLGGTLLRLAAYYPLSSPAFDWLDNVASAAVFTTVVVTVASLRRERRSAGFVLAWAGGTLLLLAAASAAWTASKKEQGAPAVDLRVQAPVAGYAGRAGSLEGYLGDVRAAAGESERAAKAQAAGPAAR